MIHGEKLKKMARNNPNPELIRALFSYDDATGFIFWRPRDPSSFKSLGAAKTWMNRFDGVRAFTSLSSDGYPRTTFMKMQFTAHRIAWVLIYGEWPQGSIDHINGDKTDNRKENLRAASHTQNMKNYPLTKRNTSGIKGVSWHKTNKKWVSQISVNGVKKTIGYFLDKNSAAEAYAKASAEFHGQFGRTS